MTTHEEREQVIVLLNEAVTAGARQAKACEVLGGCPRIPTNS